MPLILLTKSYPHRYTAVKSDLTAATEQAMNKQKKSVWNDVLSDLEKEVSRANFLTLFKNTALLSLEENPLSQQEQVATIAASSPMIINLIQKRFLPLLKKTIEKHTKKEVSIVLVPKTLTPKKHNGGNGPLFAQDAPQNAAPFVGHLPRVRSDYTFGSLAVSASNQLAYVSAQTVAGNIGGSYNPLFIYGPVGVGKTHLMHAIANDVYQKNPQKKIIYITSEEFTNEVVEAIRTNQTHVMKKRFRSIDLLIIDDVQFIAGKDRVQEELFHTFNILIDRSAQVVLSCDRPPSEIKKLESRLSSRFAAGLAVDIEPPDFELRCAILLIKSRKYAFDFPIELAKLVAQHVQDARSLEGTLLRVITEVRTTDAVVSEVLILKILDKQEAISEKRIHPDDVMNAVCHYFGVKPTQLKGPRRDASLVRARQVTMYILKHNLNLTFSEIGHLLGGRDHTTVMHGVNKIARTVDSQSGVSAEIKGIEKVLGG